MREGYSPIADETVSVMRTRRRVARCDAGKRDGPTADGLEGRDSKASAALDSVTGQAPPPDSASISTLLGQTMSA